MQLVCIKVMVRTFVQRQPQTIKHRHQWSTTTTNNQKQPQTIKDNNKRSTITANDQRQPQTIKDNHKRSKTTTNDQRQSQTIKNNHKRSKTTTNDKKQPQTIKDNHKRSKTTTNDQEQLQRSKITTKRLNPRNKWIRQLREPWVNSDSQTGGSQALHACRKTHKRKNKPSTWHRASNIPKSSKCFYRCAWLCTPGCATGECWGRAKLPCPRCPSPPCTCTASLRPRPKAPGSGRCFPGGVYSEHFRSLFLRSNGTAW